MINLVQFALAIYHSIDLAKNTKEFLMGIDEDVDYGFDLYDEEEVLNRTQEICDYWYSRWLEKRLTTVDIIERLSAFNVSDLLVGNI